MCLSLVRDQTVRVAVMISSCKIHRIIGKQSKTSSLCVCFNGLILKDVMVIINSVQLRA